MTIKLLVVSKSKNTNRILEYMKASGGPDFEVVLHLGDKTSDYKITSISRMKVKLGTAGHLMEDSVYTGAAEDVIQDPDYFRLRDVFADHMNRASQSYMYKSNELADMQDFYDYYHVIADTLAAKIKASGATHCLLFNVPHLGYDTVVYQIAKAMGLTITIVTQSLFPDRYFSMRDVGDYGAVRAIADAPRYQIEKGSKPELFYMAGVKQEREEGGRITWKALVQLFYFLVTKRPLQALNPFYLVRTLKRMQSVYGAFPKWRDPFARFFHEDSLAYFDHMASFEDGIFDLSGDYVYFPLQLQPEMTTSALGGRYRDQAYAIERLSALLPKGVRILVKENPKQGAYMRGPLFFHRLRRIPSVEILPSWADTHALTANAKFVAAITGTVGWEAIRAGVPALVFGKAWYRGLPGVTEMSETVSYADVVNNSVDHDELENAVGGLIAAAHQGVVDRQYAKIVDGFDEMGNETAVAQTLLGLLRGQEDYSFE